MEMIHCSVPKLTFTQDAGTLTTSYFIFACCWPFWSTSAPRMWWQVRFSSGRHHSLLLIHKHNTHSTLLIHIHWFSVAVIWPDFSFLKYFFQNFSGPMGTLQSTHSQSQRMTTACVTHTGAVVGWTLWQHCQHLWLSHYLAFSLW